MEKYENRLILREYKVKPLKEINNIKNNNFEYAVWANSENIYKIIKTKFYFINGAIIVGCVFVFAVVIGFYGLLFI